LYYDKRRELYKEIETKRDSKLIVFVTGDRPGWETQISKDCINWFVEILDTIGPTKKISLIIETNGGDTLAAWRLVNLIKTFCDTLEIIIPLRALSAGTLISIGADSIVMTKQAALGPIDPSLTNPLNPSVILHGQPRTIPVSVESVRGYLSAVRDELGIKGEDSLKDVLVNLTQYLHPLVLGDIFRSRDQIRFLAKKLLKNQISDPDKMERLIQFICGDSGSHDYTINRREARELGLNVENPSQELYTLLRKVQESYVSELCLLEPYQAEVVLGDMESKSVAMTRLLIESTEGGSYGYVSELTLSRTTIQGPFGPQKAIDEHRSFEGWKKLR